MEHKVAVITKIPKGMETKYSQMIRFKPKQILCKLIFLMRIKDQVNLTEIKMLERRSNRNKLMIILPLLPLKKASYLF